MCSYKRETFPKQQLISNRFHRAYLTYLEAVWRKGSGLERHLQEAATTGS